MKAEDYSDNGEDFKIRMARATASAILTSKIASASRQFDGTQCVRLNGVVYSIFKRNNRDIILQENNADKSPRGILMIPRSRVGKVVDYRTRISVYIPADIPKIFSCETM